MRSPFAFYAGLLLGVTASNIAFAVDFDCNKTSTLVEHAICSNAELSTLDDKLAARYNEAMRTTDDKEPLKADQRKWLNARNRCKDIRCLKEVYADRIGNLGRYTARAEKEQLPESEATSVDQQPLGHYVGTTKITTDSQESQRGKLTHMVIDVEPSDTEGYAHLKLTTWGGLKVASNLTATISSDGKLSAESVFYETAKYVFRESRSWDCKLIGRIGNYAFKGTYYCFPRSVTGRNCPPVPGYPCPQTGKMNGSFDLEKFNPSAQPR